MEFGAVFGLRPRIAFNCKDVDLASQWDAWKNQFDLCFNATKRQGRRGGASQRADHVFGNEGSTRIYGSLVFADQADKLKIQPVLRGFYCHFST